ncbi:MAG: OmpA family protein [Algicola sp.]|nr:OmpA family protein [Algicola sp.]
MTIRTTVSTALLLLSCGAVAQDNPWNISGFASFFDADADRRIINNNGATAVEDDIGFAGALGYRFTPKWEARLIVSRWDVGNNVEGSAKGFGVDALYHLNDKHLYGIFGVKHADITGPDDNLLNAGLGKRFELSDKLYLSAEILVYQSLERSYHDFGINLGLTYMFGNKVPAYAATPAPQPAASVRLDSDKDGVYDDQDSCPNTPMVDAVDSSGCTRYTMEDENVRLSINFANNKDHVDQHYYGEIERVANFMKKYADTTVVIEGHTSVKGGATYNQNLSERRAKMVAKILVSHFNVDSNRVSHMGYGESKLLNSGDTKAAHQENRRIEARLSGSKRVKVLR